MAWWGSYVGVPYSDGGRGPHSYDCWGLVRQVYADRLGVDLPLYGEISASDLVRVARAMSKGESGDGWVSVPEPRELDVVGMCGGSGGRRVVHVGVMVTDKLVLHTQRGFDSVVVPVSHPLVRGRIVRTVRWRI